MREMNPQVAGTFFSLLAPQPDLLMGGFKIFLTHSKQLF